MNKVELKSCPFCNSDNARIFPYTNGFTKNDIHCPNYECVTVFENRKFTTDEQIAELWNKRAYKNGERENTNFEKIKQMKLVKSLDYVYIDGYYDGGQYWIYGTMYDKY